MKNINVIGVSTSDAWDLRVAMSIPAPAPLAHAAAGIAVHGKRRTAAATASVDGGNT